MALNLSGVDQELFYDANTAASVSIFTVLVLPPFLLCILCVLALVIATKINGKIRFLLIEVFSTEIFGWFAYFVLYLGWPARFTSNNDITCKLSISLFVALDLFKFINTSIYAIHVYLLIKYGAKKLKWYVVIVYSFMKWTLIVIDLCGTPYIDEITVSHGFCTPNATTPGYIAVVSALMAITVFFLSIEVITCTLIVIYIKRNALAGNTSVKKGVFRLVKYFVAASVLSFINSTSINFGPLVVHQTALNSNLETFIAINYLVLLVPNITAFTTPIATIVLLKPVRDAIKNIFKKVCPCWLKNFANTVNTEEQEQQDSGTAGTCINQATTDIIPATTDVNQATSDSSPANTEISEAQTTTDNNSEIREAITANNPTTTGSGLANDDDSLDIHAITMEYTTTTP